MNRRCHAAKYRGRKTYIALNRYEVIPHFGGLHQASLKRNESNGATARKELFWPEMGK